MCSLLVADCSQIASERFDPGGSAGSPEGTGSGQLQASLGEGYDYYIQAAGRVLIS